MKHLTLTTPSWRNVHMSRLQAKKFKLNLTSLQHKWARDKKNFDAKGKIWDVKRLTKVDTNLQQPATQPAASIPKHFYFSDPCERASALMPAATSALHELRENLREVDQKLQQHCNAHKTFSIVGFDPGRVLIWPTNTTQDFEHDGRNIKVSDFRAFLQSNPKYAVIDQFWDCYMNQITTHFMPRLNREKPGITHEEAVDYLQSYGSLWLVSYPPNHGFHMHIDNLLRSDATVFTVGLGRPTVYDMVSLLQNNHEDGQLIRAVAPEGVLAMLDGESRYHWAHGVPDGHPAEKFTIVFRLFHPPELQEHVDFSPILQTNMYTMIHDGESQQISTPYHINLDADVRKYLDSVSESQ